MIKNHKLPGNILSLIPKAADDLSGMPEVLFAYLFGGLSKESPRPLSDVDIAVYLHPDSDPTGSKLDILGRLSSILATDEIDLVILNTAPLPLAIRIIKDKKLLVDNKPFARHAFESLIMRKYFDFSFLEQGILHRRFLHG